MMMKRLLILLSLFFFAQLALALPTLAEVEAEVRASRYSQAEAMMAEVVQAKPASAKARYIYAEILAHNRQYEAATTQLREARRLDPATGYADAGRVKAFEDQLQRTMARAHQPGSLAGTGAVIGAAPDAQAPAATSQMRQAPAQTTTHAAPMRNDAGGGGASLMSWLLPIGAVVLLVVLVRAFLQRQRNERQVAYAPQPGNWNASAPVGMGGGMGGAGGGYAPGQQPYGSPYGSAPTGGGALRTGLAVAGGLAAGVMVERMLHGNEARAAEAPAHALEPQPALGNGNVGGVAEDVDFERRGIDFGQGDGWGGGDAPADGGSSSGGDDGGW
jgi:tetratricopeptide (TPR) repeat protein